MITHCDVLQKAPLLPQSSNHAQPMLAVRTIALPGWDLSAAKSLASCMLATVLGLLVFQIGVNVFFQVFS